MSFFRPLLRQTAVRVGERSLLRHVGSVRTVSTRESSLRDKASVGPSTLRTAVVFVATGAGLLYYFSVEKERIEQRKRDEYANKSVGRASIGGPFTLRTTSGEPFTNEDLLGKWVLMYFGFTNCPDICPEELDKMGDAVDLVEKTHGEGSVLPVFISVDPARDSAEQVKRYVAGLTGDYESVKQACKSYRVYFSSPPDAKPTDDYLVDHSIFFYLMDPLGQFVDAFGKATSAEEVAAKTRDAMKKWEAAGGNKAAGLPSA